MELSKSGRFALSLWLGNGSRGLQSPLWMSHSGGLALKKSQETNSVMSEIKIGLEQTVLVSREGVCHV